MERFLSALALARTSSEWRITRRRGTCTGRACDVPARPGAWEFRRNRASFPVASGGVSDAPGWATITAHTPCPGLGKCGDHGTGDDLGDEEDNSSGSPPGGEVAIGDRVEWCIITTVEASHELSLDGTAHAVPHPCEALGIPKERSRLNPVGTRESRHRKAEADRRHDNAAESCAAVRTPRRTQGCSGTGWQAILLAYPPRTSAVAARELTPARWPPSISHGFR